jgi:hypothetical protein
LPRHGKSYDPNHH